jgi:RNA polymerase sigma-70 factor (ECF subfamily)
MFESPMSSTPHSLIVRLQEPGNREAWPRFVELYTPLLVYWARQLGLQEADAADLIQEVFAVLLRELPRFRRQPGKRFRGWLWTVFRNKHREGQRRQASRPAETAGPLPDTLDAPEADTLDEEEYRQYLVNRALDLMRTEFEPATWQACWQLVSDGRPAAEVAAALGLSVNAVYLAKSRVLRRLREELDGLLED